jgi:hypothetical protein
VSLFGLFTLGKPIGDVKEAKERLAFVTDKGKKERYLFSSMYQAIIEASRCVMYKSWSTANASKITSKNGVSEKSQHEA